MFKLIHSKIRVLFMGSLTVGMGLYLFSFIWVGSPQEACAQNAPCQGPKGDTGPKGDPGVGQFVGESKTKTTGKVGGWIKLRAICTKDYPGSYACNQDELVRAMQNGKLKFTSNAMWVVGTVFALGSGPNSPHCEGWTSDGSGLSASVLLNNVPGSGVVVPFFSTQTCNKSWPVACCK